MKFNKVTLGELEQLLLKLKFIGKRTENGHWLFHHPVSDALILLPKNYDRDSIVDRTHLMAVRRILIEYGLIEYDSAKESHLDLIRIDAQLLQSSR